MIGRFENFVKAHSVGSLLVCGRWMDSTPVRAFGNDFDVFDFGDCPDAQLAQRLGSCRDFVDWCLLEYELPF